MAILPMKRIHIYALLKDRKSILELLQRFGAVQLADLEEDELFIKNDITTVKCKRTRFGFGGRSARHPCIPCS